MKAKKRIEVKIDERIPEEQREGLGENWREDPWGIPVKTQVKIPKKNLLWKSLDSVHKTVPEQTSFDGISRVNLGLMILSDCKDQSEISAHPFSERFPPSQSSRETSTPKQVAVFFTDIS